MDMESVDFGVQIEPQYGFTYQHIREVASEAERLGFESIWVSDHFFMTEDSLDVNCLECWTVLTALARDTSRLRLGAMVASQSYRNPALSANMAASVDHISGGRLNYGIGAGWKEVEYNAYGYGFPGAGRRIRQLEEAVEIAKRIWTEPKATYSGRYYSVKDALCIPKPVQDPLPIWIGGTGTKTLRVAAKHADAVNFAWTHPPGFYEERYGVLRSHCEEVDRDFDEIKKSAGLMVRILDDPGAAEPARDERYLRYIGRQNPVMVVTPEKLAERIEGYVDVGVTHFILRFHFGEELVNMRRFMGEVRPRLR
jgi:F420-dependent oxidoreductase-like protein